MRPLRLGELIEPAVLADLVEAAAALEPDHDIRVLEVDGSILVAAPAPEPGSPGATDRRPSTSRPVSSGSHRLGTIEIDGPTERTRALAELLGRSIELVAGEALHGRSLASTAFEQELAIGRRIQLSLMPRRFPDLPGWEIAAAYEAAREVGGDFYDAFLIGGRSDRLGLVVGDVTGKGIAAALLMADTRALIHAAADHADTPSDSLGRVNRILVHERASGLFVTVAHGVIDVGTGSLTLASAGHDPVHLLRADGSVVPIEPAGRLLGMVDDIAAGSTRHSIEPGDAVVGHTDGVTEARSPEGVFYGEDRLRSVLAAAAGGSADAIVSAVMADVAGFRNGAEPSDDLTLLVVRRTPVDRNGGVDAPQTTPFHVPLASRSADPG
jgi:serine phosphatase RsbU (regulator of sigma subunit)